jgi:hypothetical protein
MGTMTTIVNFSTYTYGELQVDPPRWNAPPGHAPADLQRSNGIEALKRGPGKTALSRNYMQISATSSRTIFTLM